ncbi:hypothetical protein WAI453_011714 [Rhynchosporium graminicola]
MIDNVLTKPRCLPIRVVKRWIRKLADKLTNLSRLENPFRPGGADRLRPQQEYWCPRASKFPSSRGKKSDRDRVSNIYDKNTPTEFALAARQQKETRSRRDDFVPLEHSAHMEGGSQHSRFPWLYPHFDIVIERTDDPVFGLASWCLPDACLESTEPRKNSFRCRFWDSLWKEI